MESGRSQATAETLAFSSFLSGAYASAVVALFFLVVDSLRGEPFFTPSLLGSAFLLGEAPSAVSGARADMVALYSLVHFAAFSLLGAAATLAYVKEEVLQRQPLLLAGAILALLGVGSLVVELFVVPGLVTTIGPTLLFVANTLAAGVMGWFVHAAASDAALSPAVSSARATPSTRSTH